MKADKAKVTRLLKTARGQIDGILKMIEEDQYCVDISNQIMASEAILRRANKEVIRAHMEHCVKDAFQGDDPQEMATKIDEVMTILDKMSK